MRTRSVTLPVVGLVLAMVATFAVGVAGSATAGGLTKAAVKKIAAKVVSRQAAKLSVAHARSTDTATTANNAIELAGQPASAYQTPSYRYQLPTGGAPFTNAAYALNGLPPGSYVFTYNVIATVSVPGSTHHHRWPPARPSARPSPSWSGPPSPTRARPAGRGQ